MSPGFDAVKDHVEFGVNCISTIFTLFGNGLLLRAFYKVRSLRTPANMLLVSLAIADLMYIVSFVLHILKCWLGHDFSCIFNVFHRRVFFAVNAIVLLNLAAISIERLVAIKFSLRYIELVTKRRVKIAVAIVWIFGIALNVVPFTLKIVWRLIETEDEDSFEDLLLGSYPPHTDVSDRKESCVGNQSAQNQTWNGHRVFFLFSFSKLLLPYVITVVCHAWIFVIARQHYKRVKAQLEHLSPHLSLQMKHAKTTALVMGSFLFLFTPLVIAVFLKSFTKGRMVRFLHLCIARLVSSQCAWVNPLIYAWRNEGFRKAFCEILNPVYSRLCRCRSDAENQDPPRIQSEGRYEEYRLRKIGPNSILRSNYTD